MDCRSQCNLYRRSGLTARLEGASYRARDEKHNIVVTGRRCSTTKPKPEAKVSLTFASSQDVYRFAHSNPVSLTILSVNLRVTPPAELLPTKIHNFWQAWAKVRGKLARVR
jgi:hypothetical protein